MPTVTPQPLPSQDCNHPVARLPGYRTVRPLRTRGLPRELLAVREGPAGFRRLCSLRFAPTDDHTGNELAREAAIVARLHHPTILPAFDLLETEGWRVLVLAFEGVFTVERISAAMRKRPVRLDPEAALFVAHSVFDALAHAHAKSEAVDGPGAGPIVHGDIHPANLIVRRDGHVLLRGFRGAVPVHERNDEPLGPYAAPELKRGAEASKRSDVFGAAAVVWELFVGHPLTADTDTHVPSLAVARPELPADLAAVFDVCLSANPDDRRIHAATVASMLRKVVELHGGRESLERLYMRVLRRLPASVRALCAGTLPPRVPQDSIPTDRYVRSGQRVMIVGHPTHPLHQSQASRREPQDAVGCVLPAALADDGPAACADDLPQGFDDETPTLRKLSGALPERSDLPDDDDGASTLVRQPRESTQQPHVSVHRPAPAAAHFRRIGRDNSGVEPRSIPPVSTDSNETPALRSGTTARRLAIAAAITTLLAPAAWCIGQYGAGPLWSSLSKQSTPASVRATAPLEVSAAQNSESEASPAQPPARASAASAPSAPSGASAAQPAGQPLEQPSTSAAAAVSKPPAVQPSAPELPDVLFHQTLIVVEGPPRGVVYVNGVAVGETDQPVLTRGCGLRFVRVGTKASGPTLRGVRWLSKGQTANLPCGGKATLRARPK